MPKIGVLISGRGSNLGAVLDAIDQKQLDAEVVIVISNRSDAEGLHRAQRANVPTCVVSHKDYATREAFDERLVEELRKVGAEWVLLAGFMRIVTRTLLQAFPWRVINIHPSLLPAFPGVDAQAQALRYGVLFSGCTVHLVDEGTDTGPILAQSVVPVRPSDTRDELAARILEKEHKTLVDVLQQIARGSLIIRPASDPTAHPQILHSSSETFLQG